MYMCTRSVEVGMVHPAVVLRDIECQQADILPPSCIAISRYTCTAPLFLYEEMYTEYAQLRADGACFSSILPVPEKISCIINT